MATTSLTNMLALIRADGELPISVIDDTELTAMINVAISNLQTFLDSFNPEVTVLPVVTTTINVVTGTNSYTLPADFLRMHSIDGVNLYSKPYALQIFPWQDRDLFDRPFSTFYVYLSYHILDTTLHIRPMPVRPEALTVRYVADSPTLTTGSDTFNNFSLSGQQYVLADVLIRYFRRRGMDYTMWALEKQSNEDALKKQFRSNNKFQVQFMSSPSFHRRGSI